MSDCVFCKIIAGEFGTTFVYEDDYVVAFDDLSPQSPIHTLVVPRAHAAGLAEVTDAETMAAIFRAVPRVAALKGVDESGFRVIVNNGPDANQTVPHLHVHVMGGRPMAHGMVQFEDA